MRRLWRIGLTVLWLRWNSLVALDRLAHGLRRDGSTFVRGVIRLVSLEKPSVQEEVNPNIALGAFEMRRRAERANLLEIES
jgi:hypothetical protein